VSDYRLSKCAMFELYHAENKSHIDEIRFVFGQHIELDFYSAGPQLSG